LGGRQCIYIAREMLDDTSQQVDLGTPREKIYLQTGVIVLIDNVNRDKQHNTTDSLSFMKPSTLVKVFFEIYTKANNLNCDILSQILTQRVQHCY
jgi:hypothetical protein